MILHTEITGEGHPLVLIHSGGMSASSEYEEQRDFFIEKGFQVIRPDLRGHGKSVGLIDNYFANCTEDIMDTLENLNIESCHLAGVSLGGIAALLFAQKYPHKVKTLTFSGIFPERPENWEELTKQEAAHHEVLFKREEVIEYMNQMHGENDWRAMLASWQQEDFYPFEETGAVRDLSMPTMCLVGGESSLEFEAACCYKKSNESIQVSIIPFAGHLVHRDQPKLYSETLLVFLQQHQ
ncbi:alpha/beta fold hydrolase [Sutcliffiella sp. NPDC057660]|uniref:alpha/beta fold hydrolase n=1 Tax=Sutcliffiella sp. NPDC057660 TaxID=3346199 RepID=UPI0036975350